MAATFPRGVRSRVVIGSVSGIALVAFVTAAFLYLKSGRFGPPRALITPISQRLVVPPGSMHGYANYRITNRGGSNLVLGDMTTSCGCSVASVDQRVLAHGQSAIVKVDAAPLGAGEKTVQVRIVSNSVPDADLVLTLTLVGSATVPYVSASPEVLNLGTVRFDGDPKEFFLETRERQDASPWIQSADCTLSELRITGGLESEKSMNGGIVLRHYQ